MLLYTRVAPPKQPKRRSRGGCTYCKEKKKKCDEKRPKCSRCAEHGAECAYEAVKPRQRRRRQSAQLSIPGSPSRLQLIHRRLSEASHYSHDVDYLVRRDEDYRHFWPYSFLEPGAPSPTDSNFDTFSMASFSPTDFLDTHEAETASDDGHDPVSGAVVRRSTSLHPDLAMIAPCPAGSPLLDFCLPAFSEFSDRRNRRALVDHFCNVLSHLIVFREETGNPFQQLVLPLTRESSPVTNAIFALASAHLEYRGVENAEKSLYFQNLAIRGVAQLIEHNSKANRNEILAAIMLLVYYECLVQKGHSNIVAGHLKGALTIMCTNPNPSDPTSVFLERAFRFYDVITALSNGTAPLSTPPTPGCLQPLSPLGAPAASPLCNVDTLLGMATTLWPIIHRLAGLRALKTELETAVRTNEAGPSKIAVLRTEFESTAQAIETALLQWQPQLPPGFTADDDDDDDDDSDELTYPDEITNESTAEDRILADQPVSTDSSSSSSSPLFPHTTTTTTNKKPSPLASIHHNALAYRHAALVYLYRTVRGHPRSHRAVQAHARLALAHCVRTVAHAGPMSALLWPLFVSACEAVADADRRLAARAFAAVERRQGMRNIDRAWAIVREVWRRGDEEGVQGGGATTTTTTACGDAGWEGEELWRRVSREMGVSIVFG
ncbi:hypothetical protein VTK56DRAFT_8776 [Thermocarpiscus australiensis]